MKKLLILPLFLLSGCAVHVEPVTAKFPEAPATLQEKCAALKEVAETYFKATNKGLCALDCNNKEVFRYPRD